MPTVPERPVVQLALEANENGVIEERTYENAVILGPAVVMPQGDVTLEFNTFVVDPSSLFIEIPEGQAFQGAIGLRKVTFRRCELRSITIVGTAKVLDEIKAGFELPRAQSAEQAAPVEAVARSFA